MNCARGCSPVSEEERQNIIKWSERIENVLSNEQGRLLFKNFLARLDLQEDLDSITFWEMLTDLEGLANTILQKQKGIIGGGDVSLASILSNFNSESEDLINFALDKVNLDLMQLQELTAIKDGPEHCLRLTPGTKASVASLLKTSYDEFVKTLVESRLSLNN